MLFVNILQDAGAYWNLWISLFTSLKCKWKPQLHVRILNIKKTFAVANFLIIFFLIIIPQYDNSIYNASSD